MATCVPIKDLKDTAAFTRIVEEAAGPVTVTRNGYDAFVVMRSDDYEAQQQELAKARLLARMAQAEREIAEGRMADGEGFFEKLKQDHGL